ncbi:MAG: ACT domain-containing protein [Oscillospiraceae bacterium]|jgi:ACT domain-containing protein|nr:ACT domain-containing protein [Oscillospiraceae bacterium]
MRAVITVLGKDMVGILSKVSTRCAQRNVNIMDVTQSILQDVFAMVMLVDISALDGEFSEFAQELTELGQEMGQSIHTMHEDIFNSMHRI